MPLDLLLIRMPFRGAGLPGSAQTVRTQTHVFGQSVCARGVICSGFFFTFVKLKVPDTNIELKVERLNLDVNCAKLIGSRCNLVKTSDQALRT